MEKFKVGDTVIIDNLRKPSGLSLNGTIGHIGKIIEVSEPESDDPWYRLEPYCSGGSWHARNLRYHYVTGMESWDIIIAPSTTKPILIKVPVI